MTHDAQCASPETAGLLHTLVQADSRFDPLDPPSSCGQTKAAAALGGLVTRLRRSVVRAAAPPVR